MNLLDLYALTAIVVTTWGIKSAMDHYDPDDRYRALHAGFYHFPKSRTCPEGYDASPLGRNLPPGGD